MRNFNLIERIGKEVTKKAKFQDFFNSVKSFRVTKKVKEVKFELVWGELESEESFERQ